MKTSPTTEQDIPMLEEWIKNDPHHKDQSASFWLTPNGLLTFALSDNNGPIAFVRIDRDSDVRARLHTQFGPYSDVSKLRLARGMLKILPVLFDWLKSSGYREVCFDSVSPKLISFMNRLGFVPDGVNDYVLTF